MHLVIGQAADDAPAAAALAESPPDRKPPELRAFVEDVAHQIRTPLTVLLTHAHLIEVTARQIPPHDAYAEACARIAESAAAIQQSAARLAREVRDIAERARATDGATRPTG